MSWGIHAGRSLLFAAACALVSASPSLAQEITESHLKAARAALAAIHATDVYDGILPNAADQLKQQLIQKNPDLQSLISKTVDEKTIAMAGRRADLEKEAATAYAKAFTEEQLNTIATFYESDAGKKLISDGPIVVRELNKSAQIWQNGVARDLAEEVGKVLSANAPKQPAQFPAPAEAPAAPATAN